MLLKTAKFRTILTFALLTVQSALGAVVFRDPDELPRDVEYDFVIVGGTYSPRPNKKPRNRIHHVGGTGGAVVASRLGENPKWNILVIEAGPSYVF